MIFIEWARRWGLPECAIAEYLQMTGAAWSESHRQAISEREGNPGSESRQQSLVRLDAAAHDVLLFRNNSGVLQNPDTGRYVRFGLANDSKKMNDRFKSHDLIGLRRLLIQPHMVGSIIGQFVARECKEENWSYTGSDREVAQLAFGELINSYGGDAKFATGKGTF